MNYFSCLFSVTFHFLSPGTHEVWLLLSLHSVRGSWVLSVDVHCPLAPGPFRQLSELLFLQPQALFILYSQLPTSRQALQSSRIQWTNMTHKPIDG